ncbi:MAG: hypothetical protein ACLTWR_13235 [Agathobaculum desmolans]
MSEKTNNFLATGTAIPQNGAAVFLFYLQETLIIFSPLSFDIG